MEDYFWYWFIGILIICSFVLALSIYKVYIWFQEHKHELFTITEEDKKYINIYTFRYITKVRSKIAIILSVILIVFIAIFTTVVKIEPFIATCILIGLMFILIIMNNRFVSKKWVCPYCNQPLPVRVGRGGIRPKLTNTCPRCNLD